MSSFIATIKDVSKYIDVSKVEWSSTFMKIFGAMKRADLDGFGDKKHLFTEKD